MSSPTRAESARAGGGVDDKSKLLLQRERELFELRVQRQRAEEWLSALHAVWPERSDVPLERLARRATDLLVGELSFEYAATLEYHSPSGELEFGCADPVELTAGLRIAPDVARHLEHERVGRYAAAEPAVLLSLARALTLEKFFWRCAESYRGTRFLFVAGSTPRTANFHVFPDSDRDHFAMFTSHAAALLSNSLLVSDVRREGAELESANRGLDASLRELEQTQAQLLASTQLVAMASRQAGMAEIATGILHNVGNVLNSVNVCGDVALSGVTALPIDGLDRMVELLSGQDDLSEFFRNDPRAPKTVEYLRRLSVQLRQEKDHVSSELEQMMQHLAHVGSIVSRQQAYAKSGSVERCSLPQLMEDALLLARGAKHSRKVEVIREFEDSPDVVVDRHRVLQILVNLITNALQALKDSGRPDQRLTARIDTTERQTVRLAIEDNGIGIAQEHAAQLFQHGFTTRRDGHGFGLHTSGLTAKELGGSLAFQSAGPGRGATFVLELPLITSAEGSSEESLPCAQASQASLDQVLR